MRSSHSPSASTSLLSDTSAYSTPTLPSSDKIDYTTLHLPDADVDRALARYQAHARSASKPWLTLRKGRLHVSRKALLLGLVATVGVLMVVSRAVGAEEGEYGERLGRLRGWSEGLREKAAGWYVAPIAGEGQEANDPSKPVRVHKYAGSRRFPPPAAPLAATEVLNFATPQDTLAAQLKAGVRYITTMAYGGHANQFISIQKMLFMAKQTSRVAVIPSLIPIHIDGLATLMSEFYDVDRLVADSAIPAVEFNQLKEIDMTSTKPHNERISCWSVQELAIGHPNGQATSFDIHDIWIDHWALPPMSRGMGGQDIAFDALKIFDFDAWARQQWIEKSRREFLPQEAPRALDPSLPADAQPAQKTGRDNMKAGFDPVTFAPPTDQMLCYDNSLFIGPVMFQEAYPGSVPLEDPAPGEDTSWMQVGQHIHFNRELEALADDYLVDLFGCGDASRIPPFISIHLRRGDFKEFTGFTALDKYISGLTRLRERLQRRLDDPFSHRGVFLKNFRHFGRRADAYEVVVTTDEQPGTDFWREVEGMGWRIVDHEKRETKERLGPWHMTMLDSAILARGQGFVGTGHSTFSHLAGLRVKYWNGGLVDGAF